MKIFVQIFAIVFVYIIHLIHCWHVLHGDAQIVCFSLASFSCAHRLLKLKPFIGGSPRFGWIDIRFLDGVGHYLSVDLSKESILRWYVCL